MPKKLGLQALLAYLNDEKKILVILLLLGSFFRLYNLSNAPFLWIDEGYHVDTALHVLNKQELARYFWDVPVLSKPPLYFIFLAGSFKLLGFGLLQARLVNAIFSISIVLLVYSFAKRYFGRNVAIIASLLYAVFPTTLWVDRTVTMDTSASFFMFLAFILFYEGYSTKNFKTVLISGVFWGLAFVTKYTAVYMWIGVCVYLLVISIGAKTEIRSNIKNFLIFSFSGVAAALPWFFYKSWYLSNRKELVGVRGYTFWSDISVLDQFLAFVNWQGWVVFLSTNIDRWGRFFLEDEVILLGLIGIVSFTLTKEKLGIYVSSIMLSGVLLFSLSVKFAENYIHFMIILLLIFSAYFLVSLLDRDANDLKKNKRNLMVILLISAILVKWMVGGYIYGLKTENAEIRAAQYLDEEIPGDAIIYSGANIGVFSGHRYVDIYLPLPRNKTSGRKYEGARIYDYVRAYENFNISYIVVDYQLRLEINSKRAKEPCEVFECQLVKTVGEGAHRVDIYELINLKKT